MKYSLLLTALCIGLFGFAQIEGEFVDIPEESVSTSSYPFLGQNGKYGLRSEKAILAEPAFDRIQNLFRQNYLVKKDHQFGVLDAHGRFLIPLSYDSIEYINRAHMPFYAVYKKQVCAGFDSAGKKVSSFIFKEIFAATSKSELLLVTTPEGEKAVYYGDTKKVDSIEAAAVLFNAIIYKRKKRWGIVNTNGEIAGSGFNEIHSDQGSTFLYGNEITVYKPYWKVGFERFRVKKDNLYGIMDIHGRMIVPLEYQFIYEINGLYIVKTGDLEGAFDPKGNSVLPVEYRIIKPAHHRASPLFYVKKDSLWGCLRKGKVLLDAQYEEISYLLNSFSLRNNNSKDGASFLFARHKNGKFAIIDEKHGKLVSEAVYHNIKQFLPVGEHFFFIVKKGGKWGIVDEQNSIILPFAYESLDFSLNSYAVTPSSLAITAQRGKQFGITNLKEEVLIPFSYQHIAKVHYSDVEPDVYKAKKNGFYQLINENNQVLNPGPFDEIGPFEKGRAAAFYKGRMVLLNTKGEKVSNPVAIQPHEGFSTFLELKKELIVALDDPQDKKLKDFSIKVSPSLHLLTFLSTKGFDRKSLPDTAEIADIRRAYFLKLLEFKRRDWASYQRSSLIDVHDPTDFAKGFASNYRFEDHAFGSRFLELLLRDAIRVNGYWISSFFLKRGFRER